MEFLTKLFEIHPDLAAAIYKLRWQIELLYKLLKSRIELENFSDKTAQVVKQDFNAKVFLMTFCSAYAHPIEDRVIEDCSADESRKFDQKLTVQIHYQ